MTNLKFTLQDKTDNKTFFDFIHHFDKPEMCVIGINNQTIRLNKEQVLFLAKQLNNFLEIINKTARVEDLAAIFANDVINPENKP